jgi:hypothetical protein
MNQLGVFMGRDLEPNYESFHLMRLNDWVLSEYGCSWDKPPSVSTIKDISPTRSKIIEHLKAYTSGIQMMRYFGPSKYYQFKLQRFFSSWGWKDPRNTFTAWLWDEIFPDASYIYIVRCGVDAAQSLVNRERQIYQGYPLIDRTKKIKRILFELLTVRRTFFDFLPNLKNNGLKVSLKCTSLENAFGLWENYLEAALEFLETKSGKNRLIEVNYEKLIEQPAKYINMLADFSGLNISREQEDKILSKIDASRRFPFRKEPHLVKFYNNVRQSTFMRYYKYDNIR